MNKEMRGSLHSGFGVFRALGLLACCWPFGALQAAGGKSPVDFVNPLIGTSGHGAEYGGTLPLVGPPFAMTPWTAMTRLSHIGRTSYSYDDSRIIGFIGTHQPAVWMGDYGAVSMMPGTGKLKIGYEERALPFARASEQATPYRYEVSLGQPGEAIRVALAARGKAALLEFAFPAGTQPFVVIDASRDYTGVERTQQKAAEGWISVDAERQEISGYNSDLQSGHLMRDLPNFRGYFVLVFDRPFASCGTYANSAPGAAPEIAAAQPGSGIEAKADQVGAYVRFAQPGIVRVRVGTSFISCEQARKNLEREIPHFDLDAVAEATRRDWERQLSRIEVTGGDENLKAIFYSGLYRAHLLPREFSENGRYYSAADDRVHDGESYQDFSLWDTWRALHPLLILTAPERVSGMMNALVQMSQQSGWLPIWPNPGDTGIMVGAPAEAVIAEAWVKGVRGFEIEAAWKEIAHHAGTPQSGDMESRWVDRGPRGDHPETRAGLTWYLSHGYVAADATDESVSRTLEYAYADHCNAVLADAIGKPAEAAVFRERSGNYRNLYHDGLFMPRWKDGSFRRFGRDYTEATPQVYFFSVFHDVPGLMALVGGASAFERRLDDFFEGKWYRHDNEPSHHIPYLYDYCGAPWKTQKAVRDSMATHYRNDPVGYSGNEDCGQMSAWFIMSSLGFYPVNPVSGEYAIGSPLWDEAVVHTGSSRSFRILCKGQGPGNCYIQSARLNGTPLARPFLRHEDLVNGGILELEMGAEPNKTWPAENAEEPGR